MSKRIILGMLIVVQLQKETESNKRESTKNKQRKSSAYRSSLGKHILYIYKYIYRNKQRKYSLDSVASAGPSRSEDWV